MNKKHRFRIGDIVKIRHDVEVGVIYYSEDGQFGDKFSSSMSKNIGKEAKVVGFRNGGYVLQFDKHIDQIFTYYYGMLELAKDELAEEQYKFNPDVEALLLHLERERYKKLIDEALDNRLFETNPDEFKKLVDAYNNIV